MHVVMSHGSSGDVLKARVWCDRLWWSEVGWGTVVCKGDLKTVSLGWWVVQSHASSGGLLRQWYCSLHGRRRRLWQSLWGWVWLLVLQYHSTHQGGGEVWWSDLQSSRTVLHPLPPSKIKLSKHKRTHTHTQSLLISTGEFTNSLRTTSQTTTKQPS